MIRTLLVLVCVFAAAPVVAADEEATAASSVLAPVQPESAAPVPQPSRGILPSLYVSLAALQAFDAYSTTQALNRGAVEANPMMKTVAGHSAALWAVKGGTTAASIYFAERLWKQKRRREAIVLMIATNTLMGAVVAHNASVLRTLGR